MSTTRHKIYIIIIENIKGGDVQYVCFARAHPLVMYAYHFHMVGIVWNVVFVVCIYRVVDNTKRELKYTMKNDEKRSEGEKSLRSRAVGS